MKKIILILTMALLLGAGCSQLNSKNTKVKDKALLDKNQSSQSIPVELDEPLKKITEEIMYKQAILKTNFGDIVIEFYADDSPRTVKNFQDLAESGFYNNIKFHRVIDNFMIQAGDPLSREDAKKNMWGTGGPGYKFEDEINNHKLVKGSVAMANAGPDTNGSQFFIVTADSTPWLDGLHTNFGQVVEGMEVVDKISQVKTDSQDRPLSPVVIEVVELE